MLTFLKVLLLGVALAWLAYLVTHTQIVPLPDVPKQMHFAYTGSRHQFGLLYGDASERDLVASWDNISVTCRGETQVADGIAHALKQVHDCAWEKPRPTPIDLTKLRQSCQWGAVKAPDITDSCVSEQGAVLGLVQKHDEFPPFKAFTEGAYCEGQGIGFVTRQAARACIERTYQVKP